MLPGFLVERIGRGDQNRAADQIERNQAEFPAHLLREQARDVAIHIVDRQGQIRQTRFVAKRHENVLHLGDLLVDQQLTERQRLTFIRRVGAHRLQLLQKRLGGLRSDEFLGDQHIGQSLIAFDGCGVKIRRSRRPRWHTSRWCWLGVLSQRGRHRGMGNIDLGSLRLQLRQRGNRIRVVGVFLENAFVLQDGL